MCCRAPVLRPPSPELGGHPGDRGGARTSRPDHRFRGQLARLTSSGSRWRLAWVAQVPYDRAVMETRPAAPRGLRGRVSECAVLDGLIEEVRRGESRSLVLRGEAGIGKTALVQYLVESAVGMTVLRAVGVESEMELAYASLHQLCAPLLDRFEGLPAPQRDALRVVFGEMGGAAPDRFMVGLGVLSLLSEVAEERPLLCVVDDAQWLDQASAVTLAFVARRLGAEPLGIVFATREPDEELQQVSELEVRGLSNGDARALLATAVRPILDKRIRERIIAETRGNPLALLELPRGLTASELAVGLGLVDPQALADRIEESFIRRLEALSWDARRFLVQAAAEPAGDPVLLWSAAEQLGIERAAADHAQDAGLLAIGERVIFRHPLVRSAAYGSAAIEDRQAGAFGAGGGDRSGGRSGPSVVAPGRGDYGPRRGGRRGA